MVFPLLKTFGGDKGGKLQDRVDNLSRGAQIGIDIATNVGGTAIQIATDKSLRSTDNAQSAIVDGEVVAGQVIQTSETLVRHNLGREPVGAVVIGASLAQPIAMTEFTSASFMAVTVGSSATFSFWVF